MYYFAQKNKKKSVFADILKYVLNACFKTLVLKQTTLQETSHANYGSIALHSGHLRLNDQ